MFMQCSGSIVNACMFQGELVWLLFKIHLFVDHVLGKLPRMQKLRSLNVGMVPWKLLIDFAILRCVEFVLWCH